MKIAIIHDHLGSPGGGERAMMLLALELGADFITAYADKDTFPEYQEKMGAKLICLSAEARKMRGIRFFWLRWLFRKNRGLLKRYDILIASSQAATEAVAAHARPDCLKAVYTHTPPRRVYDQYDISKRMYPLWLRPAYAVFTRMWKFLYERALRRIDLNIANSKNVRDRLRKFTPFDVNAIVWPPVETGKFRWIKDGDYFLSFGRNDEAKRIELIARAFKRMPDKKLAVCSGGPRLEAVKRIAEGAGNIKVLGWVSDEKLIELVGGCRAAVYIPMDEDAGMSHLEANAAGKPYLGVREGGLIESTIHNETGILIPADPSIDDVINGIKKMTPEWCSSKKEPCLLHAAQYDSRFFYEKMKGIIADNDPRLPVLGIDASRWEDPRFPGKRRRTGVEVYSKNIISELVKLAAENKMRVRVYTTRTIRSLPLLIQKIIPAGRGWTGIKLNAELGHSPVDYFFTPSYYIPKNAPKKSFAVLHDVIFKSDPDKYSWRNRLSQELAAKTNIKRAEKIFTVSNHSKSEILKYYSLPEEKVVVAPMGYEPNSKFQITNSKLNSKLQNRKLLYIGRIEKKKSVDVLVRAFGEFAKSRPEWKLVLAGADGFGADEARSLIRDLGLGGKVELAGYVSEGKKWELLASASIFVHPSSSEGSSIPLLEAFDAGVPAIAADVPAMREVGEAAALYFKPGDAVDLSRKMDCLAGDTDLQKALAKKGRAALGRRSWEKSAEMILSQITDDR